MSEGRRRSWFGRRHGDSSPVVASQVSAAPAEPVSEPTAVRLEGDALDAVHARLTDYVYVQVRSGAYGLVDLRRLSLDAAGTELADPAQADEIAREVLARELQDWRDDADRWGPRTDCDRLDQAMERLANQGVLALSGLVDEPARAESIRVRGAEDGCVCYLVSDIWQAIDTNSLPIRVLDGDGAPAGRRSDLTRRVIDALSLSGLLGSPGPDEGQVAVAMVWRRRPSF